MDVPCVPWEKGQSHAEDEDRLQMDVPCVPSTERQSHAEDEGRLQMDVPCVPWETRQSHVKTRVDFTWMCLVSHQQKGRAM